MAITSVGFKGTVGQSEDARRWGRMGPRFTVGNATDLLVSPAAGDRTVSIAAGTAQAGAVLMTSDAAASYSLPANASGQTRYDLIIARFLWTDPITQPAFTHILGVPGAGLPKYADLARALGTQFDGALAVVRVANGQGTLTGNDIFDVRAWGGAAGPLQCSQPLYVAAIDGQLGDELRINSDARRLRNSGTAWVGPGRSSANAAMVGSAPPAGVSTYKKITTGTLTINANGDGTIAYDGGAFPNGLTDLDLDHVSPSGPPSNNIQFIRWGYTLGQTNARAYVAGTPVAGPLSIAINLVAEGW